MLQRPTLKRSLHVEIVEGEGVLFLSDGTHSVGCGSVYEQLVPLLAGQHTTEEIVRKLWSECEPLAVYAALGELEMSGHVTEAASALLMHAYEQPLQQYSPRQHGVERPIAVSVVGDLPRDDCLKALRAYGFAPDESGRMLVVFTDSYFRPVLGEINKRALRDKQPWLVVRPGDNTAWIGPLFIPDETCCWECLEHRLRGNLPVESYLLRLKGTTVRPGDRGAISNTVAVLAAEVEGGSETALRDRLGGAIVVFNQPGCEGERHVLPRRPQCRVCGDPNAYARQVTTPLDLVSRQKLFTSDGGHRSVRPEITVRRFDALVDRISGVVSGVEKLNGAGGTPLHAYLVRYHGRSTNESLIDLRRATRWSRGKGMTDAQARVSGIGEAIERYSAVFQGDEPRIRASFENIVEQAIRPNSCMLFSEEQYGCRDVWNRRHGGCNRVPVPFDPSVPLAWTPVWSLTERRHKYLPTAYLYDDFPEPHEDSYCVADSNGSAAGNVREEAILQGLLELVERDCIAIWWYGRVCPPALDLGGVDDVSLHEHREYYQSCDREFWMLDITSDLGVPCFAAVSRRLHHPIEEIVLGFGAHLDPLAAVRRAVSEMYQVLATVRPTKRQPYRLDPSIESWLREATVVNHPYLRPGPAQPTRLDRFPDVAGTDLREDVRWCQRLLEARGLELLVLDQTRPDVGVPVVKVVVPGLRHCYARFAPGRLYDVPVAMGWRAEPLAETELNPTPFFL